MNNSNLEENPSENDEMEAEFSYRECLFLDQIDDLETKLVGLEGKYLTLEGEKQILQQEKQHLEEENRRLRGNCLFETLRFYRNCDFFKFKIINYSNVAVRYHPFKHKCFPLNYGSTFRYSSVYTLCLFIHFNSIYTILFFLFSLFSRATYGRCKNWHKYVISNTPLDGAYLNNILF